MSMLPRQNQSMQGGGLLDSPFVMMGLGGLSNPQNPFAGIMQGMLGSQQMAQRQREQQLREQLLAAKLAEAKQAQEKQQRQRQAILGPYAANPWTNPDTGQQVTGGLLDTLPAGQRPVAGLLADDPAGLAKYMQDQTKLMNVPAGGTVFDPATRQPLYQAPRRETQRDQDVSALRSRGFSQTEAEDIAAGRVKVTPPDQFGNVYLVNTATGERRVAGGGQPQGGQPGPQRQAAPSIGASRPNMAEATREGTGPWRRIGSAMDAVFGGLIGRGSLFPETAENKATIRSFNQLAKSALVNNPRFPVAEQQIVAQMLPDPDALFTNPENEVQKLETLRQTLNDVLAINQEAISSGQITQEEVGLLANKNAEIRRVLALMGGQVNRTQPQQRGPSDMSDEELLRSLGIR